jgi:hypothetical protein
VPLTDKTNQLVIAQLEPMMSQK